MCRLSWPRHTTSIQIDMEQNAMETWDLTLFCECFDFAYQVCLDYTHMSLFRLLGAGLGPFRHLEPVCDPELRVSLGAYFIEIEDLARWKKNNTQKSVPNTAFGLHFTPRHMISLHLRVPLFTTSILVQRPDFATKNSIIDNVPHIYMWLYFDH